jgi:hypothetical protein
LAIADAKAQPPSEKEKKLIKEIEYLTTLLQQKFNAPSPASKQEDPSKYMA